MLLSFSPANITYLTIVIFCAVCGTALLVGWLMLKKRLASSGDYYQKSNTNLNLWGYIKRNIMLYGAFFCYVIAISAFFLLVL